VIAWSFVLAGIGIIGLYLAGKNNRAGWAIGVGAQVLWIVYAIVTQQWGFIASAVAYSWVYSLNWWRWRAKREQEVAS
jgi:hypothetical protein